MSEEGQQSLSIDMDDRLRYRSRCFYGIPVNMNLLHVDQGNAVFSVAPKSNVRRNRNPLKTGLTVKKLLQLLERQDLCIGDADDGSGCSYGADPLGLRSAQSALRPQPRRLVWNEDGTCSFENVGRSAAELHSTLPANAFLPIGAPQKKNGQRIKKRRNKRKPETACAVKKPSPALKQGGKMEARILQRRVLHLELECIEIGKFKYRFDDEERKSSRLSVYVREKVFVYEFQVLSHNLRTINPQVVDQICQRGADSSSFSLVNSIVVPFSTVTNLLWSQSHVTITVSEVPKCISGYSRRAELGTVALPASFLQSIDITGDQLKVSTTHTLELRGTDVGLLGKFLAQKKCEIGMVKVVAEKQPTSAESSGMPSGFDASEAICWGTPLGRAASPEPAKRPYSEADSRTIRIPSLSELADLDYLIPSVEVETVEVPYESTEEEQPSDESPQYATMTILQSCPVDSTECFDSAFFQPAEVSQAEPYGMVAEQEEVALVGCPYVDAPEPAERVLYGTDLPTVISHSFQCLEASQNGPERFNEVSPRHFHGTAGMAYASPRTVQDLDTNWCLLAESTGSEEAQPIPVSNPGPFLDHSFLIPLISPGASITI